MCIRNVALIKLCIEKFDVEKTCTLSLFGSFIPKYRQKIDRFKKQH